MPLRQTIGQPRTLCRMRASSSPASSSSMLSDHSQTCNPTIWKRTWPTLVHVLREIESLSHPGVDYDASDSEPAPQDALL
ncbi:hypothetical protein BDB00DRAFT_875206 [Zychaea mexicana]|uniref:uncharacterized protein n=1 Tax=Zychaea mexicana TaxID=64656 RepID=UPI0022FECAAD|nr:uncharacterized protein BDB00DRAFT_875206 [Zychaea mexicana]KAI9490608.1 hypothetical protein BDB00DRAFT_875206 [Zychaea mexicana]